MVEELTVKAQEADLREQLSIYPEDISLIAKLGQLYAENKRFNDAYPYFIKLNKLNPDNATFTYNLGLLCQDMKKYDEAIYWYNITIELFPRYLEAFTQLGSIYLKKHNLELAEQFFLKALDINDSLPESANAFNQLAVLNIENNQIELAIENFNKALDINPEAYFSRLNLVNAYLIKLDYEKAKQELDKIPSNNNLSTVKSVQYARIAAKEGNVQHAIDILNNALANSANQENVLYWMAQIYEQADEHKNAKIYREKALAYNPNNLELLELEIKQAWRDSDYDAIINTCEKILNIDPTNISAYQNIAYACYDMGNFDGARTSLEILTGLEPNKIEYYLSLGMVTIQMDDHQKSAEYLVKALEMSPNNSDILAYLGKLSRTTQSLELVKKVCYNSFIDLVNQFEKQKNADKQILYYTASQSSALSNYVSACMKSCDWDNFEKIKPILENVVEDQLEECRNNPGSGLGMTTFIAQFTLDTKKFLLPIAEHYAKGSMPSATDKIFKSYDKADEKKLRIGYISPDFQFHVVGFLINDLFSYHDRDKFEIYGYALRNEYDEIRTTIENSCDHFKELYGMQQYEAAKIIHDDKIDILIDLAGYTAASRPDILAFKPAPVQAHMLGQVGTMGAEYIKYHLTTKTLTPNDQLNLYNEKIVYLPDTPIATTRHSVPDECPTKSEYGLPENKFIFCCLNNTYRFDREVFNCWIQILKQVPDSVLWLTNIDNAFDNLCKYAERAGIDRNRLIPRPLARLNIDWHHRLADLYLDTFTVTGGTTNILSSIVGLPVITINGNTPQSTFGAGINEALGVSQYVTVNSKEEYVKRAIELANNPDELNNIKQTLLKNLDTTTLFNKKKFISQLEQAYQAMWDDNKCNGENKVINI